MPVIKGQEWTFDTVASEYAVRRPGYPEELYQAIFRAVPIGRSSHVVEVGIGGGQATLPVLRTGCRLTAVEYGPHFSAFCREKFRDYPNFSVVTGRFEETDLPAASCDLIFSASAFHWIPEEIGYPRVFAALRPGGVFARFANHPFADKGRPRLAEEIQKLYAVYMPGSRPPAEFTDQQAGQRADIARKYGFTDIRYQLFHRTRTFSGAEYAALLGTYSDHIALEAGLRAEFFRRVQQTIDRHGGAFTLYDTIDLQLAKKP